MGVEKLLHDNTVLSYFRVELDGFEIVKDDLVTVEITQNINEFGLSGFMLVKDTYDFNNNGETVLDGDNTITIRKTDFMGFKSTRTYRVTSISVDITQENFKLYRISFIDIISFKLMNTYISKSFTDTPVNALQEYFVYLGIDKMLKNDNLVLDVLDTSTKRSFVVPGNISLLEFFEGIFRLDNIRLYQDRFGVHIKEIIPSKLIPKENTDGYAIVYTNNTLNNEYLYKIHDYSEDKNNVLETNTLLPKRRTYQFNSSKNIQDTTNNVQDILTDLTLNDLSMKSQLTTGEQLTEHINGLKLQKYDLFNVYLNNNNVRIAITGELNSSNICNVALLELKGNILAQDTIRDGDQLTSGRYFIAKVTDKIIGDKLIQKLTLIRLDSRKPRIAGVN